MSRPGAPGSREVLIEIVIIGTSAKASAIDVATGTEVSVIGPANAPRASLEKLAVQKLDYMLKRKS